jgi:hypothetical protein
MLTEANKHEDQHHGRDADQDLPSATTRKSKQPIKIKIIHEATNQSQRPRFWYAYVHGVQRRSDPAGVAGRARGGGVGGRVHPARDVVDAPRDVGGQRGHAAARRLRRLQEGREVAHGGRGAVRLAHHVVQRRRRAAAQLALPVVQDRARDAATHAISP